jgi:mRNA interferase MazF
MPTFERGAVVRVPFPYTDRSTRQYRPALVVSNDELGEAGSLLWVLMITSAENRPWRGDVAFEGDFRNAGLPAPSVVRTAKIATIDASSADKIGNVTVPILERVLAEVRKTLGR